MVHNVWNEIWLSPLLGNNRTLLIERCGDLVAADQSGSFIYLAASHPLLEVVTQKILDRSKRSGVWGELPVYLFRGFTQWLISSAVDDVGRGMPPRIPIDRDELPLKRSLVSQILLRLRHARDQPAQELALDRSEVEEAVDDQQFHV